jgi:hypothetical protein
MTSLIVIPSARENSAASFGTNRMSGHRTIRVNPATISVTKIPMDSTVPESWNVCACPLRRRADRAASY